MNSAKEQMVSCRSRYFVSGVFYPTNHVVITLDDAYSSTCMQESYRTQGFDACDIFSLSDTEIIARDVQRHASGKAQHLFDFFSGCLGQESINHGEYVDLARQGRPLLLAFAPNIDVTVRAIDIARLYRPIRMRKYESAGVIDIY